MNQRIKQLVQDAGIRIGPVIKTSPPPNVQCALTDLEKFAELIVRECVRIVEEDNGIQSLPIVIKEHFGVEE
jgi:hypothetical protein